MADACSAELPPAPTGMSREQLHDLLFNRAAKGSQRNPYEEKAYRGPDHRGGGSKVKSGYGITNTNVRRWSWTLMASYMHSGTRKRMLVPRLMHMDHCAKRWQTRKGTYQLKRRRLLPDVRDPPEQGDEEVDMTDICHFCEFFTGSSLVCVCWGGVVVCICLVCFVFPLMPWKTPASNSGFTFFCFRIPRKLTDHAPCSLGNAREKKTVPNCPQPYLGGSLLVVTNE